MNATSGNHGIGQDHSVRLTCMVEDEREHVTLRKSVYDWNHPENAKSLSFDELADIARRRLMERLCRPPETTEEVVSRRREMD